MRQDYQVNERSTFDKLLSEVLLQQNIMAISIKLIKVEILITSQSTVGNQALRAGKNTNQLHHKDFENGHMLTFKIAILLSHGDD